MLTTLEMLISASVEARDLVALNTNGINWAVEEEANGTLDPLKC